MRLSTKKSLKVYQEHACQRRRDSDGSREYACAFSRLSIRRFLLSPSPHPLRHPTHARRKSSQHAPRHLPPRRQRRRRRRRRHRISLLQREREKKGHPFYCCRRQKRRHNKVLPSASTVCSDVGFLVNVLAESRPGQHGRKLLLHTTGVVCAGKM